MKKILKLGLSALALSVLAACGNSGSSEASKATGSSSEESKSTGLSTESSKATGLSTEESHDTEDFSDDTEDFSDDTEDFSDDTEDFSDDTEDFSDDTEDFSDDTEEYSDESDFSSEESGMPALYLAGTFNDWTKYDDTYALEWDELTEMYSIEDVGLKANAQFKVMGLVDGEEKWYPNDNVTVAEAGQYDIDFDPVTHYVTTIWVGEYEGDIEEVTYHLSGSFNGWAVHDHNYQLSYDASADYYAIEGILFEEGYALKVTDSDGHWYPDGMGNDYLVQEEGIYDVHFDPKGGHDGWHSGFFEVVPTEN
ncbi:MAG: hypothetical protein J6A47_03070 [Bacilli bacterium]|nr:hypothetical protein [Bacilli bacterium]